MNVNVHVKRGALLLGIGLTLLLVVYVSLPIFRAKQQAATSDAAVMQGRMRLGVDNWIGYFPLCSAELKRRMRGSQWDLRCEDDKADYAARMARLRDAELDFAVATVDSYILNAAAHDFPGVIIMVIDESQGGDAILVRKDRIPNLDALKGHPDFTIAFTPNSPSHHLLKATADHFGAPELLPAAERRIETQGSEAALQKFLSGEADIAVLWEPNVSQALAQENVMALMSTASTRQLIVDILLVSRTFSTAQPHAVSVLLSHYFQVLKEYRDDPTSLRADVSAETGLPDTSLDSMLRGVAWVNLTDNCQHWFGLAAPGTSASQGIVDTIESTVGILLSNQDFNRNPLPDEDPYRLTQSKYLEALCPLGRTGLLAAGGPSATPAPDSLTAPFPSLTEAAWDRLKEVGTLKNRSITFQSGTSQLSLQGKRQLDEAVDNLRHYPKFRVVIKGHTAPKGDPAANRVLSQERAAAVARYFTVTYGVDSPRLRTLGFGGEQGLPRQPGESRRAYRDRLARVELILASEVY